jgi:hypothetical protein
LMQCRWCCCCFLAVSGFVVYAMHKTEREVSSE